MTRLKERRKMKRRERKYRSVPVFIVVISASYDVLLFGLHTLISNIIYELF